ncbi:AraC family transcriptional regulator [Natronospirillum operosum]|uniref:AraC family transcriptional regulator n=1 Tax=Natronospirillum operosum TaxID=2759953 RepID=A0A4Z0W8E7_9GAMM|nr:AraC family transcriptional regulator [Natronospirillum operosum]TGG93877.1 AraC family transcriptional regulator [Natronospirillum operosum]
MEALPEHQSSPIEDTYSRSALQILSAYWQERDDRASAGRVQRGYRMESDLLQRRPDEIWKLALELSNDDHLGLHASAALVHHTKGCFFTTLAANSTTVGEALKNFCHYHELRSAAPHPRLEYRDNRAVMTIVGLDEAADEAIVRHMVECLFSAIVTTLGAVSRQPIYPTAVRFTWPAPADTALHQRVFKAPLYFGAHSTALEFALDTLDATIPYADEFLLSTLTQYADSQLNAMQASDNTWSKRVRSAAGHAGLSTDLNIDSVAKSLCVSPRTLQLRLKVEGTSYQAIIREMRISIGKEYLANSSMPLAEVALLLGYSEQSAFNHAFRQWTGMTPRQFRNSARDAGKTATL